MGRTEEAVVVEGLRRRVAELEAENSALRERLRGIEEAASAQVRVLVEEESRAEAQKLVKVLDRIVPSAALERWKRALAPPTVWIEERDPGNTYKQNLAWIREHASEHTGKWVALRNGVFVDEDLERDALYQRLEQSGQLTGALFARL